MITKMQKTIIEIADYARQNGIDPIEAVREYFDEKDSHFSRARVAEILVIAREAEKEMKGNEMKYEFKTRLGFAKTVNGEDKQIRLCAKQSGESPQ